MNSLAKFLGLKLETIILLREQTTGSGTWGLRSLDASNLARPTSQESGLVFICFIIGYFHQS